MSHVTKLAGHIVGPRIKKQAAAIVAAALLVLVSAAPAYAATGTLYLSPRAKTIKKGAVVEISLRIDPGTNVNGASAEITYDSTKLAYISNDASNSVFPLVLEENYSTNPITATRGRADSGVTADSLILKLTFKAKVGSGTTSIGLTGNAASNGAATNPTTKGATITFSGSQAAPNTGSSTPASDKPSSDSPATTPGSDQAPDKTDSPATDPTDTPDQGETATDNSAAANNTTPNNRSVMLWAGIIFLVAMIGVLLLVRSMRNPMAIPSARATPAHATTRPDPGFIAPKTEEMQAALDKTPGLTRPDPGVVVDPQKPENPHDTQA